MTQRQTVQCFFRSCKAPVAYTVHQTWNGKTVHCCETHKPGSKARPGIDTPDRFYRVEPLTELDRQHADARLNPPPYEIRKQLRERTRKGTPSR